MSTPRAVIITMSPLLADIFRELLSPQVAIEVVAEIGHDGPLEQRLRALQPDLVLIGLRSGEADGIALSVVMALPHAKVIAFSSDARHAYVYKMRPHRTELNDVSKDALLAILKV
jgi:DNA-binding NarL/FixJ family response regulator